ncbi:MAG: ComF family protein [Natronincolaceae bacterium]|jgi:competence protein ComFC|nr:ComF family protein [Bacillota bacterium]NLK90903.1 ComF family protein [Clostridiales bacterium]
MKILKTIGEYTNAFLDLIYPSKTICYICGGTLEENAKYSLCSNCYNNLPFIPEHHCTKCSTPLRMIEDGPICRQCKDTNYYFDRAISIAEYKKDVKTLIYKLKYSGHTYLATTIGCIMADKLKQEGIETDIIIPVPLYKRKEKERGFNQAILISKYMAEKTNMPLNIDAFIRIKNTKVMHNLSRRERLENVKGAFKVINRGTIANKDVLLVDDIFTTGSTVNSCSKELTDNGAKSVTVLTFARD